MKSSSQACRYLHEKTLRVSLQEELGIELGKNVCGFFPLHTPHKLHMASSCQIVAIQKPHHSLTIEEAWHGSHAQTFHGKFQAFGFNIGHLCYYTSFNLCWCWTSFKHCDVSMVGWHFNLKLEFVEFACSNSNTCRMAPFSHVCSHKTTISSLANRK